MDWIIVCLAVLFVVGAISKGVEGSKAKQAAEAEKKERKERSEKAREAILTSGNQEMINKLHLMDASYQQNSASSASPVQSRGGSSALGTAAAVAGGLVVADAITTGIHQAELETAMADIEADLEADFSELKVDFDGVETDLDETDFDLEL